VRAWNSQPNPYPPTTNAILAPYGVRLALNVLVERWLSRPTQQTIADGEANLRIEVAEILVVELHFIVVLARMERVEVGNAFDAQE
jgi:hypothetical protein